MGKTSDFGHKVSNMWAKYKGNTKQNIYGAKLQISGAKFQIFGQNTKEMQSRQYLGVNFSFGGNQIFGKYKGNTKQNIFWGNSNSGGKIANILAKYKGNTKQIHRRRRK